jgi:hypothetical protein
VSEGRGIEGSSIVAGVAIASACWEPQVYAQRHQQAGIAHHIYVQHCSPHLRAALHTTPTCSIKQYIYAQHFQGTLL